MSFEIVDPNDFLIENQFIEEKFLEKADEFKWSEFKDKKVLVRGCGSTIIPPWVFMLITGKLAPFARSIRYGNEHNNIIVYKRPKDY